MGPKATPSARPTGSQGKVIPYIPFTNDTLTAFEKVQGFLNSMESGYEARGFGTAILRENLTLVSATVNPSPSGPASTCVFTLHVTPSLCNRMGILHGGAIALVIDIATTLALAPIARPGFWQYGGVSRTLSVTYLRPAPLGTTVRIVAEVVQAGRAVCTLKGSVFDDVSGKILSVAEHGKVTIDPPLVAEEEVKVKVNAKL